MKQISGTNSFALILVLRMFIICSLGNDLPDYRNHPCIRRCVDNKPMTCEYDFTLEYYYVLNRACYSCPFNVTDCDRPHCVPADGVSRGVMVVNRMLPGPGIHVCEGDIVVVKVKNKLEGGEGTTIHWHGILQHGSQYMDGVAMVTQCPIAAHSSFKYRFNASTPGTMFWHAHAGLQRSDGVYGNLVIRQSPSREAHLDLYDFDLPDHTILVNDWLVELTSNRFAAHHHDDGDNKPRSMLISGRGVQKHFIDPETGKKHHTPYAVFTVKPGKRYRFRVASNGILNCPLQFSVDSHQLLIIATDGAPVQPLEVDSFNIFAGERYDFVLSTSKETDNYWLRVRGLADCGEHFKKAKQNAILRYEGAPDVHPVWPSHYNGGKRGGVRLNTWNRKASQSQIAVSQLDGLHDDDDKTVSQEKPDKKFYLAMDFNIIDNYHFHHPQYYSLSSISNTRKRLYSPQINHISTMFPPAPPLGQLADIPQSLFCNNDTIRVNCKQEFCECIHLLKVSLGDVVELILVDEGVAFDANHPMHLHGHRFRVLAMDRVGKSTTVEEIMNMDKEGKIKRKLRRSVVKDTVTVPDGGYTVIRFHADNPGFWLFHCHIEFHLEIGMGLIFQVGEPEDMPLRPRKFPTCGDWEYPEDELDDKTKQNNDTVVNPCKNNSIGPCSCCYVIALVLVTVAMTKV